jgi:hypothetical protein
MIETVFVWSGVLVVPFWTLMILLPNWRWTRRIIASPWIVLPVGVVYALVALPYFPAFFSISPLDLSAMAELFGTEAVVAGTWLHFIAMDLFAGRIAYCDSQNLKMTPVLSGVLLVTIMIAAPLGVVLYLIARRFYIGSGDGLQVI